jgi:hypothetical protein
VSTTVGTGTLEYKYLSPLLANETDIQPIAGFKILYYTSSANRSLGNIGGGGDFGNSLMHSRLSE